MKKEDRRKYNSGTIGNKGGTGRPPVDNPRKTRTIRATDEEYKLIKRLKNCMKHDIESCKQAIAELERTKNVL